MFWYEVTNLLRFTGIDDVTVWQDVAISTVLIPVGLIVANWLHDQWDRVRPSRAILNGYLDKNSPVLIFHSQMSGADDNWNFNPTQKYITKYPDPLPTDSTHLGVQKKQRIDPVLSKAEADCLADIYNVLGRSGKVINIIGADMINDWGKWSNPIFTIGFNPKTNKLIQKCVPIYFKLQDEGNGNIVIIDIHNKISYEAILPNDAGVIQKTYTKSSHVPIFILAGLGTAGTSAGGYVLSKHLIELGKLYGNSPFCVFLKVLTNEGRESAYMHKIFPYPRWYRKVLYPFTFYSYSNSNLFN